MSWAGKPATVPVTAAVWWAFALGAVVTLTVAATPLLSFAYASVPAHVALVSGESVVALVGAHLMYGRFRQREDFRDLLLASSLALMGVTNVAFSVLPLSIAEEHIEPLSTWGALLSRLLATGGFAAAALLPARPVRIPRPAGAVAGLAVLGSIAAIGGATALLAGVLPEAVDVGLLPAVSVRPHLVGHPGLMVVQGMQVLLYGAAAVGFARRAASAGDEFLAWFAAGAVLSGWARVNYLLYPSLYSQWLYAGDFLRAGFYVLVLVGATTEIRRYWSSMATAAVLDERRRIARDLHDGLAQELALISAQSRTLSRAAGSDSPMHLIAGAATRALDESRAAIDALTSPLDVPLDLQLAQAVESAAQRFGVRVKLELDSAAEVPGAAREPLVRIAREAVTNAARHGAPDSVSVSLICEDGIRLEIGDDGRGFSPDDVSGAGFGLVSMRERAESIGAELRLRSAPGSGTVVEVFLP